ncbi:MAG: DNA-3-methyladenine glycosylase 2 family protein [Acidobacteria bacterium]|nr:DNA-3-methyladenine glycosylase 2 family protein [Acidobacteriota bacterium]
MDSNRRRLYAALAAHDPRLDGVFFVGVTSTGIYCRPTCTVRTPKSTNCRFFSSAGAAEQEGFRPCLRCRPELAPGLPIDDSQRVARLIVQRLEEAALDERKGLDAIAGQFELSARQMRRLVREALGVSPMQLLRTRRLLLAKQLLTETRLRVADVSGAAGFSSVRRLNEDFRLRYRMPRARLRRTAAAQTAATGGGTSTLQLAYRPPYDWDGILAFLGARALKGVEWIGGDAYWRTVRLGGVQGWIRVTSAQGKNALRLEFAHSLTPALPALLNRVRALFDLNARPDLISTHLAGDVRLAGEVARNPGIRVPGAFEGFEIGLRAILGQQITVKGATTIAGRFVEAFGDPIVTPVAALHRLTPRASRVAAAGVGDIARLGIVAARARSLIALAEAQRSHALCLDGGAHQRPEETIERLVELPGIGAWTAQYIAMRALQWPDAFPKEDVVIRANLGGITAKEAEALSQPWRPWRSYAVMHVWRMAGQHASIRRPAGAGTRGGLRPLRVTGGRHDPG